MARTATETRIQDRTARNGLAARNKPYWRVHSQGAHIGYRRGKLKGSWHARYLSRRARGDYVTTVLGEADDAGEADGETLLNWKQALDNANYCFTLQAKGGTETALNPDITVAEAVDAYITMRDARRATQAGREVRSDASHKLTRLVLQNKQFARLPLAKPRRGRPQGLAATGRAQVHQYPARGQRPEGRAQRSLGPASPRAARRPVGRRD